MRHFLHRRCWLATGALAGLAGLVLPVAALGQATTPATNPATSPPVRLLVGYAAGGPVDAMARIFAPALAQVLGANVIVENKPGASGALAGELTVAAPPDGSTLFFAASPTLTIVPHIQKRMRYDPARDLTAIAPLLSYANVLVVPKDSPLRSLADLLAAARPTRARCFTARPGSVRATT